MNYKNSEITRIRKEKLIQKKEFKIMIKAKNTKIAIHQQMLKITKNKI